MTRSRTSSELTELYCATCEGTFRDGELCPSDGTRLVRLLAASDPLIGREIDGRFTILEKLGQGGMGTVYRARQHSVGREVAIKVLPTGLVGDATSIKRFLREAKLASRLTHPNVVGILDFGQTRDGVFYLVMELVTGETLQALLAREHRLELPRMMRIALQLCDALDGAHALPMVHRDLKPSNVMVLAHGRDHIKVLDFGLAKSLLLETTTGTTSTGTLLGTPMFLPPEIANGDPADARSDLYSLGCMLYMMGTGQPPFVTDSVLGMIAMHGTMTPPAMSGVPASIAMVVDRLLEKEPDVRYQTAAEVRSALEDAYHELRATGPRSSVIEGVSRSGATGLPGESARQAIAASAPGAAAVAVSSPAPPLAAVGEPAIAPQAPRARSPWRIAVVIVVVAIVAAAAVAVFPSIADRAASGEPPAGARAEPSGAALPAGSPGAAAVEPARTRSANAGAGAGAANDGRVAPEVTAPLDARPMGDVSAAAAAASDARAVDEAGAAAPGTGSIARAPGDAGSESDEQAAEPAGKHRRSRSKSSSSKANLGTARARPASDHDGRDDDTPLPASSTSSVRPGAGSSSPF
jgi:serine/threonine-protein kinase